MSWLEDFFRNLSRNPFFFLGGGHQVTDAMNAANSDTILRNAEEDPTKTQGELAINGYNLTPEQEKYLDNLIEQQNVNSNNAFQEYMRNTSLLSSGSQLQQLGLSPSGVLQTGGAASGVTSQAADAVKNNMSLHRYQQRMGIARQLLSMTSQMASAGIYGNAIASARKASSVLTSAASHSAYAAMQAHADNVWNQALMENPELRNWQDVEL